MPIANVPTRRLVVSSGAMLALAACAGSPNAGTTPAQIIADANGLIVSLGQVVNILANQPGVLSADVIARSQALLAQAGTVASSLATTVSANVAAPVLAQIESALNTVLGSLGGILLPPPYGTIVAAAAALLPVIGAYVAQYLPRPGVGVAAPSPVAATAARRRLGIPELAH